MVVPRLPRNRNAGERALYHMAITLRAIPEWSFLMSHALTSLSWATSLGASPSLSRPA
ncbi:hypothetical protein B7760_05779 (plasmid) [Burkholderia glumae]|nr:hypothetical protein B7760_05779 [Burkholderia glumae]